MRRMFGLLGLVVIVAPLAACFAPPATTLSTAVGSLTLPWDVQWTPGADPVMLLTERPGRLEAVVGGRTRTIAAPSDLLSQYESGMMGLAIDPAFASNRRVYTCMHSSVAGGVGDIRVVRWAVNATFTGTTSRADIVTGIPVNTAGHAGQHSGCRPRFGPDGALWIGTGDSWTGSVPQDKQSLGGKVLRVGTDGAGVAPNPGVGANGDHSFDPRIYSYGHRNVQGIAFRPSDGKAFSVEQGTTCDDEVNQLLPGGNYGWDPLGAGGAYDETHPMTDLTKYPAAVPAVWTSGCPTIATSGAGFVTGSQWGRWNGMLVIGCLKGSELFGVMLDSAGTKTLGTSSTLTDHGRLRTPAQGPDGSLYVTTGAGSADSILALRPQPPT